MKVNSKQLPIKAHFFFFMAAMGPILPFLPVYGKQLGVSPLVMGSITAVLPILFLIAKPTFGLLVDYFQVWRKSIFIGLLAVTSGCFVLLYFLPTLPGPILPEDGFRDVPCAKLRYCSASQNIPPPDKCHGGRNATCHWSCNDNTNFFAFTFFHDYHEELNSSCLLHPITNVTCDRSTLCNVTCDDFNDNCLYASVTFWGFVLLMSLGTIGYNVSNCISDSICFDVLGEGGQMGYGRQRVWGTIGFGITAFLAGYTVDCWSRGQSMKNYTPAFIFILMFSFVDLLCCKKLELPITSGSKSIVKDVYKLLRLKPIIIFLCFATLAGILDSFIIYFLFWYLEDLAKMTGHMSQIKLIEGLIVAAETLGGEVIFFSLSGKILKKIGYGYSFAFCFICYAIRLGLISVASTPWWVIPIELFMQGPTYALCYTTIVAYASAISPPGTSATVQGIVAGMDDGFGFALGSLIGGILYKRVGGATTLRLFASLAAVSSFTYLIFYILYLERTMPGKDANIKWKDPKNAAAECTQGDCDNCC